MKSLICHYRNKYPNGKVHASESTLQVFDENNELRVCLQKNGAGQMLDVSKEYGAIDCHDLSPIPKEARFTKLYSDGRIDKAEEHAERKPQAVELAKKNNGKVPSMEDLENAKMK